jgi:tetratricopeptide (TPR) repeat protein
VHAYSPADPFPLVRMGDMHALLGHPGEAVGAFLLALERSETQFVHMKVGVLLAESPEPERALEHLSRAFELDAAAASHFSLRQFSQATYSYALALSRTGKTEEARQTLAVLLQNEPGNADARRLWTKVAKPNEPIPVFK